VYPAFLIAMSTLIVIFLPYEITFWFSCGFFVDFCSVFCECSICWLQKIPEIPSCLRKIPKYQPLGFLRAFKWFFESFIKVFCGFYWFFLMVSTSGTFLESSSHLAEFSSHVVESISDLSDF
jgi:hypothetical protein